MLHLWLRYYGQFFKPEDTYILGHDVPGDAGKQLATAASQGFYQLVPVHRPHSYDTRWLTRTVTEFQRFLLQSYRVVVFAAVDEFIIVRREGGLFRYMADSPQIVRCHGWEVVHQRPDEPGLVFEKPILAQRKMWAASKRYSKPLIARTPIYWQPGFTQAVNVRPEQNYDDGVIVVHLHKVDFNFLVYRHRLLAAKRWHPAEINSPLYEHNRTDDLERLAAWMLISSDDPSKPVELTAIPEVIRSGAGL